MFNLQKTLALMKGALLEPQDNWEAYHAENNNWQTTAVLLTGPLIVGSILLEYIFSWLFSSSSPWALRGLPISGGGFLQLLLSLVVAILAFVVFVFIFNFFAGMFKGKSDFSKAFAAVSLAAVPAYVGDVLAWVPWIGWLISLGMAVYALVLLYKIVPTYLGVPNASRAAHYAVSLIVGLIAGAILAVTFGGGMVGGSIEADRTADRGDNGKRVSRYGVLGDLQRHSEFVDQAMEDKYDPPAGGRLTEKQVLAYLGVMRRTAELRDEYAEDFQKRAETAEGEKSKNLSKVFSGIQDVFNFETAEVQVVKAGGGNWAEHQWVKDQLRIARIQKDTSKAIRHNYNLYKKYEDQIRKYK